jgi:hypothetical protein
LWQQGEHMMMAAPRAAQVDGVVGGGVAGVQRDHHVQPAGV